jgi:hypothetical protein
MRCRWSFEPNAQAASKPESDVMIILATAPDQKFHAQTIRHHARFEVHCSIETEGSGQETIGSGSRQLAMR